MVSCHQWLNKNAPSVNRAQTNLHHHGGDGNRPAIGKLLLQHYALLIDYEIFGLGCVQRDRRGALEVFAVRTHRDELSDNFVKKNSQRPNKCRFPEI